MEEPYLSTIMLWSGNQIPRDWMPCEGQELNRDSYPALHSLLEDTYGGNGHSTFKLPDLRDRASAGGIKGLKYLICVKGRWPA